MDHYVCQSQQAADLALYFTYMMMSVVCIHTVLCKKLIVFQ